MSTRLVTIGGSDAAAACRVDPYRSRLRLAAEKLGLIDPPHESEAMRWGRVLEPVIDDELTRRGFEVMPHPQDVTLTDDRGRKPWLTGRPDGYAVLAGTRGLLERKTVSAYAHDGTVPAHYACQVQHYLHLTGLPACLLAVLVGGQRLETHVLERDDRAIALILEREEELFTYLKRGKLPPADQGTEDERSTLVVLRPDHAPGKRHRVSTADMVHVEALRAIHYQQAQLKDARRRHEDALIEAAGDAEELIDPYDARIAWFRHVASSRIDTKALRSAHPRIAEEFTTTTHTRPFKLVT